MSEVIGVCGHIGSGKSHFSKLIADRFEYHHINCDQLFKQKVSSDHQYIEAVTKFGKMYDIEVFKNGEYNKDLASIIFSFEEYKDEYPKLDLLNKFNQIFLNNVIVDEVSKYDKVLIEMAVLVDNPIKVLCDKIFLIESYSLTRIKPWYICIPDKLVENVKNRDVNRDEVLIRSILCYQIAKLKKNYKDVTKISNRNKESFASDSSLIEQFRKLTGK